ncbi:Stonustoxin subunit beta [Merluccius polli]|uniref:Stonustoxin subunit beta n=1 Tax=Merluccius polli TaxID=89951 RepID=A0AA47MNN7_MERPO|nr:Stonustoxin subunit beta [Merluccius polli]
MDQLDQLQETWEMEMKPVLRSTLLHDACGLTLDPNTANRHLTLSEDLRKVTQNENHSYPDRPERFDHQPQVLCRESLTGRCYWEVEWREDGIIGVAYRGITRKGWKHDSKLGMNNKPWSLYCHDDGSYIAYYNGQEAAKCHLTPVSTGVGVYLDRPAGSLSFYRVSPGEGGSSNTLTLIHKFHTTFTQEEDLLAGFGFYGPDSSVSLCGL